MSNINADKLLKAIERDKVRADIIDFYEEVLLVRELKEYITEEATPSPEPENTDKTKAILASLKHYQNKYVESKKENKQLKDVLGSLGIVVPEQSEKHKHEQNLIDGMINGGDLPIQQIRDMIGGKSPEPQNTPSLNPKAVLHSNITAELNAIYIAKNSDYGDAFGETYKKLGIISAVTRITDKVNRLQSLATKSESERLVKDETILDTLKDAANYILMTLIEMGYEPPDNKKVDITADHLSLGGSTMDEVAQDLSKMGTHIRNTME